MIDRSMPYLYMVVSIQLQLAAVTTVVATPKSTLAIERGSDLSSEPAEAFLRTVSQHQNNTRRECQDNLSSQWQAEKQNTNAAWLATKHAYESHASPISSPVFVLAIAAPQVRVV